MICINNFVKWYQLDERGYVQIDEHFHTTCDGVYAIGDAAGQPAFTHVSWEDYRRLKAILCGKQRQRSDRSHLIPKDFSLQDD